MVSVPQDEALGVYVSVPFCRAKCSFCNFASGVGNAGEIERYVEALVAEIGAARGRAAAMGAVLPQRVDTVYFGGGTPSLLEARQFAAIMSTVRWEFLIAPGAEITMEAAPGQIGDELLDAAMREGVNRVSLGVQSFEDREAAAVGRTHTRASCVAEFERLRGAGVMDVGVDLIAGLPYATRESWDASLGELAHPALTHASVYLFEIDEDSRLGAEVLRGGARMHAPAVADETLTAEMYERACEVLPGMGFGQYEISNFAREGFRSRHNRKYWTRAPYVGFGLDAHSMLRGSGGDLRFANADELVNYSLGLRAKPELIGEDAAFEEAVFLGLRMVEGVDAGELERQFGEERVRGVGEQVRELVRAGLMVDESGYWSLTMRGRLVSNEVFGRLLEERTAAAA